MVTGSAASGADDHFWQLYTTSLPHVYGYLVRRCDRQTAEDLTQEVYSDLARRMRRGDDLASFTTGWLMTVARSRLIDHVRSQHRQERKLSLAWSRSNDDERGGRMRDVERSSEIDERTERALGALAADERCALVLHHLDGLRVADVATLIGRSHRATESLLARARRRFRAAYEEVRCG